MDNKTHCRSYAWFNFPSDNAESILVAKSSEPRHVFFPTSLCGFFVFGPASRALLLLLLLLRRLLRLLAVSHTLSITTFTLINLIINHSHNTHSLSPSLTTLAITTLSIITHSHTLSLTISHLTTPAITTLSIITHSHTLSLTISHLTTQAITTVCIITHSRM